MLSIWLLIYTKQDKTAIFQLKWSTISNFLKVLITDEITEIRTDQKTNVLDEDQSEFPDAIDEYKSVKSEKVLGCSPTCLWLC